MEVTPLYRQIPVEVSICYKADSNDRPRGVFLFCFVFFNCGKVREVMSHSELNI